MQIALSLFIWHATASRPFLTAASRSDKHIRAALMRPSPAKRSANILQASAAVVRDIVKCNRRKEVRWETKGVNERDGKRTEFLRQL
jgi:hypothetical protein